MGRIGWTVAAGIVSASAFLSGCGKSTSSSTQVQLDQVSPTPMPSSRSIEGTARPNATEGEVNRTSPPASETPLSSEQREAEDQLVNVIAQYSSADETTRNNIVEHLAELTDKGVDKENIAKAFSSMFATETDANIKTSILDELEALGTTSLFERVTPALSPNEPLEVRDEAIAILKDLGDKRAISALQPFLADPDDDIREEVEDAINHLNTLP